MHTVLIVVTVAGVLIEDEFSVALRFMNTKRVCRKINQKQDLATRMETPFALSLADVHPLFGGNPNLYSAWASTSCIEAWQLSAFPRLIAYIALV